MLGFLSSVQKFDLGPIRTSGVTGCDVITSPNVHS